MIRVEDHIGNGVIVVEGATVKRTSLSDIVSDDGAQVTLEIFQPNGSNDLFIRAHDLTSQIDVPPLVIYSNSDRGPYAFIHNELLNLIGNFSKTPRQIPNDFPAETVEAEELPLYFSTRAQRGGETDPFKLKITNIEGVGNNPGSRVFVNEKYMDVEILKNGDVIVSLRHVKKDGEKKLSFLFKTKDNGGKIPLLAAVFTRIAERTEAAIAKRE